jgi:hypothetical protein
MAGGVTTNWALNVGEAQLRQFCSAIFWKYLFS